MGKSIFVTVPLALESCQIPPAILCNPTTCYLYILLYPPNFRHRNQDQAVSEMERRSGKLIDIVDCLLLVLSLFYVMAQLKRLAPQERGRKAESDACVPNAPIIHVRVLRGLS